VINSQSAPAPLSGPSVSLYQEGSGWVLEEPSARWVLRDLDWVTCGITQIRRKDFDETSVLAWGNLLSYFLWYHVPKVEPSVVLQITSTHPVGAARSIVLAGGRGALAELLAMGVVGVASDVGGCSVG
jgi:hypothetical protein